MAVTLEPYRAVNEAVAWLDRSERVRLRVTGPDRVRFLHNLTTNDIQRLAVGRGCEAFVTTPHGKTLAWVTILRAEDHLLLRTDPGGLDLLLPHFQKYGALDEVTWEDVSGATFELHLAGPLAEDLLRRAGGAPPAQADLTHAATPLAGRPVFLVREAPTGRSGLTLIGERDHAEALMNLLNERGRPLGLVELDSPTFEALRIEAGTPINGREVTPENLPQEVGRDARAISFTKGCYLGQETVARLDALGHVNKILKGLRIEGPTVPPPGTALELEGKPVGTITSSAFSPGWGGPIALGYLRVAQARAATALAVALRDARPGAVVADLPMPPPGL
jgi:folate-binding protein YgfZ